MSDAPRGEQITLEHPDAAVVPSAIGRYRSLWVVAKIDGRWAAQLRSSFAA
jgi:hypothetical protein